MARNRRLVPMPSKRAASPLPLFEAPAVPVMSTPPPLQVQPPQSLLMQDFPYILLLAGAALAWIFLNPWFVLALVIQTAENLLDKRCYSALRQTPLNKHNQRREKVVEVDICPHHLPPGDLVLVRRVTQTCG